MEKGGVTVDGFLQLQEMALEDEEGGAEEIRETLRALGYDNSLNLSRVTLTNERALFRSRDW